MVFDISDAQWSEAESNLAGKADGSKFDKYQRHSSTGRRIPDTPARNHSFVVIDGIIYALSNPRTHKPGIGSTGLVKMGLTREGRVVAIKVQFGDLIDMNSPACQIAQKHRLFVGQAVRVAPNMRITIPDPNAPQKILKGKIKRYTVMEWLGEDLFNVIVEKWSIIPQVTRDLIALKACVCLQSFNETKTVHNDIKAENLTVIFEDEDVTKIQNVKVNVIDTEYALLLPPGETFVIGEDSKGSPGFVAPEIVSHNRYSPLSDSYALAVTLLFQLDVARIDIRSYFALYMRESIAALHSKPQTVLNPIEWLEKRGVQLELPLRNLFSAMLNPKVEERAGANDLIAFLCKRLISNPALPDPLKDEITGIDLNQRLQTLEKIYMQEMPPPSYIDTFLAAEGLLFLADSESSILPKSPPLEQTSQLTFESQRKPLTV